MKKTFHPGDADAKTRIDVYVKDALGLSRADTKRLFDEGRVRVGHHKAKKGDTVQPGSTVEVDVVETGTGVLPEPDASLRVLFEDAALLALDKRAGQPCHPLRPSETGTLANAIVARWPECAAVGDNPLEAGLAHRLDTETSGVVLVARTQPVWKALRAAFTERTVTKKYLAVSKGPLADEGEIGVPLAQKGDHVQPAPEADDEAREALTRFTVLSRKGAWSLVELTLVTGVMHQARAHLASVGAPIAGDTRYGGVAVPGLSRFFLHAAEVGVKHPITGSMLTANSPLPEDLRSALETLGLAAPVSSGPGPSGATR